YLVGYHNRDACYVTNKTLFRPTVGVHYSVGRFYLCFVHYVFTFSKPAAAKIHPNQREAIMVYDHDDPSLRTGAGGFTVWTLQEMAQKKQFTELNDLFNNGLTMNSLPVGLAAGAAARVLDVDNKVIADALDALTGSNWRGKVFFPSSNKKVSKGRNRIKASLLLPHAPIVPMAQFDTMLLDSHPLVPEAKSNVVILNYADPQTKPYWQELALTKVQVYDVQAAVKGKYGPVFIGKTWLGKYDKQGEFTASNPNKLIAWY